MSEVMVRYAHLKDIPELEVIERSSFTDPYPKSLLTLLTTLKSGVFLVASMEEKIAGYISAIIENPAMASIASIAIHPSYRRKKIAKKLLVELMRVLREKNILNIKLEVRERNISARSLYKTFGFKELHTIKGYYEDGEDAIVMQLSLEK